MRDQRLYVDSHHDDEATFYGDGGPPDLLGERDCSCIVFEDGRRQHGQMTVVVSEVRIGKPALASWSWRCRSCSRTADGGRWVESE